MGKTLLYIILLLGLGAGIYFFILRGKENPFGNNEAGFTVTDTASVGKFFISSATGESITAERANGYWTLNKKYRALPSMVNLVLGTVASQVVLYPVTEAAKEYAIQVLSTDGIKVELYDLKGKKFRTFYVGGISVNGSGTNMLIEGATKPFVVQAPAFNGDLRPRYSFRFADWRERSVFNIPGADINSISVQYFDKPINSYVIKREGDNNFTLTGDEAITKTLGPLNINRTRMYFDFFTNINCEGYLNGKEGMDSVIRSAVKRCQVTIEKKSGSKDLVDIYWMPINRRSKNKLVSNELVEDSYDADRMFATMNNFTDTVLIQTHTFRKVLRGAFEFYMRDSVQNVKAPKTPENVLIHTDK